MRKKLYRQIEDRQRELRRPLKERGADDMMGMEQIEVELVQAEYILCKRAADNEGVSLQEWIRQAVERYLATIRERLCD